MYCNMKDKFYNYNQTAVQFLSNQTLDPISDIMHILGWNSASKQNGNTPKDSFEKANCILNSVDWNTYVVVNAKVNRDRYNIDAPGCKKKAYMDLDFRTLNGSEI